MVKLPSFKRVSAVAAILGVVIPTVLFLFRMARWFPRLTFALWPTLPFLMATEGREHTLFSYMLVAATIAGNALVYVVVFDILWALGWVLRAARRSLRDGTTI